MDNRILNLIRAVDPENPLQYARDLVKDFAKEKLDSQIMACQDCNICHCAKTLGHGNTNASIMVIGGNAESEGEPGESSLALYDGPSQAILDKVLFEILEANREEFFFMNTVNCYPYKQTGPAKTHRLPTKTELTNCSVFLKHAIEIVQPVAIIILGSVALNAFDATKSIMKCHGEWLTVHNVPAVATFHPDYFLKVAGKKDEELVEQQKFEFIDDIAKVIKFVRNEYPHIEV